MPFLKLLHNKHLLLVLYIYIIKCERNKTCIIAQLWRRAAFANFKAWQRRTGRTVKCSHPKFRLTDEGELPAKAFNSRVITAWLSQIALGVLNSNSGNAELDAACYVVWSLGEFYTFMESHGVFLMLCLYYRAMCYRIYN